MPLGKYYCDYCDKEFQDTPLARKRHLQSSSHLRAKSLWYNSSNNNNNNTFIASGTGLCNRFVKTGFCPYGDSCKYVHPNNSLQINADVAQGLPIVLGNQSVGGSSLLGNVARDNLGLSWGNLPPSLKPPLEGGYPSLPFVDWG